jgi:predicted secreted hydrolase
MRRLIALVALAALVAGGCSSDGRILAKEPTAQPNRSSSPKPRPSAVASPAARDPRPLRFPTDEAPHDRLTEWWYYTGHLVAKDSRRFGFEFVVFRAERAGFPVSWASHLALTDERGGRFRYDERTEIGAQVDQSTARRGFDLAVQGGGPRFGMGGRTDRGTAWQMRGEDGRDQLVAASTPAAFALSLTLDAGGLEPVLHQKIGYVDFGAAGGSYYYSRTRMNASGTVTLAEENAPLRVEGIAWFDHQWGDFIPLSARGGWDWFAVNLSDGTDLMISMIRDRSGNYPVAYAELVQPNGMHEHLDADAFTVRSRSRWASPTTGISYPSGWTIAIPGQELNIDLRPTVPGQELDARASTGVTYWEGSQVVQASRAGRSLGGEAYVELTGYRPPTQ